MHIDQFTSRLLEVCVRRKLNHYIIDKIKIYMVRYFSQVIYCSILAQCLRVLSQFI